MQLNEILIIAGVCNYKGFERPFICRLNLNFSVTAKKKASLDSMRESIVIERDLTTEADVIKIIGGEQDERITALNFGPYDNGYILVGT